MSSPNYFADHSASLLTALALLVLPDRPTSCAPNSCAAIRPIAGPTSQLSMHPAAVLLLQM